MTYVLLAVLGVVIGSVLRNQKKGVPSQPVQVQNQFQYTRVQKGHSLTKHLLFGWMVLYIPAIYITFSPNHYWHA